MPKQDRSLPASEQKALEAVLKLVKLGVIPSEPWERWDPGHVLPTIRPEGEKRTAIVEGARYTATITVECLSSSREWHVSHIWVRSALLDEDLDLSGRSALNFILSLAK